MQAQRRARTLLALAALAVLRNAAAGELREQVERTSQQNFAEYSDALRAPTAPQPDERPIQIRMMGGTVPTDVLIEALQLPFLLVPTVNDDNNQHAANENLRIGHFVTGAETIYSLLITPYRP